jgi:hypothetical protein
MTNLSNPRHPIVARALDLASTWCAGHVIGGAPALAHGMQVAATVDRLIPNAPAELIAVALLHDAPELAPTDMDLDSVLICQLGPAVTRALRALEHALAAGDNGDEIPVDPDDPWTLYASTADKIVSLTSVLRRSARADNAASYWCRRAHFIGQLPRYRRYSHRAAPHLPAGMAAELDDLITRAEHATTEYLPNAL